MRHLRTLLIATCTILSAVTPLAAQERPPVSSDVPAIVTGGEAVVRRAPDRAFIDLAVEARARNPRDAQRQSADVMARLQQALVAAGVPKDAIRTVGYHVQQEVDYVEGRRQPRGYVARNMVEARVDAIERTGEVIDAAVQAGATSVAGVRFDLKDRASAERAAVRMAVLDARGRADAAAAGAGLAVDRVLRIEDARRGGPPRPFVSPAMARLAESDVATPIDPGTIEIRADVILTVSMR